MKRIKNLKFTACFTLFFLCITSFAQLPSIKWGNEIANKSFDNIVKTVKINSNFYIFTNGKVQELHIVNATSLSISNTITIEFPKEKGIFYEYYDIENLGDKLHLFYKKFVKDDEISTLYAVELVNSQFNFKNAIALASDVSKSSTNEAEFMVSFSPDYKLLGVQSIPVGKSKEIQNLNFHIYATSPIKKIEVAELNLEYKIKDVEVYDFIMDDFGNVHSIVKIYSKDDQYAVGYFFKYLTYSPQTKKFTERILNIEENYVTEAFLSVDVQNNIRVAGFYSQKKSKTMKGYFYFKFVAQSLKEEKRIFNQFTDEIKAQVIGKYNVERGKDMPIFVINDIYESEDGSIYLFAENFKLLSSGGSGMRFGSTTPGMGMGMGMSSETWLFKSILTVNINKEGKTNWVSVIPKSQAYTRMSPSLGFNYSRNMRKAVQALMGDEPALKYFSFVSFMSPSKIIILYNGNHKDDEDTDEDKMKKMSDYKRAILKYVTINTKTGAKKYELMKDDDKFIFIPRLSYQYSNDKALVFSEKNNVFQLGILDLSK